MLATPLAASTSGHWHFLFIPPEMLLIPQWLTWLTPSLDSGPCSNVTLSEKSPRISECKVASHRTFHPLPCLLICYNYCITLDASAWYAYSSTWLGPGLHENGDSLKEGLLPTYLILCPEGWEQLLICSNDSIHIKSLKWISSCSVKISNLFFNLHACKRFTLYNCNHHYPMLEKLQWITAAKRPRI